MTETSQQPYLLRALYEWCVDNGYTPHITVRVDARTRVPPGFVKDGRIVLNLGPSAVRNLNMDNAWVTFSARFGGVSRNIEVPVANVDAIYARENGAGMQFSDMMAAAEAAPTPEKAEPPQHPTNKGGPRLKIVK